MEEIVKQDNSNIKEDLKDEYYEEDYYDDIGLSDFKSDFNKELIEEFVEFKGLSIKEIQDIDEYIEENTDEFNAFCKDSFSDYLNYCRYKYC